MREFLEKEVKQLRRVATSSKNPLAASPPICPRWGKGRWDAKRGTEAPLGHIDEVG